MGDVIDWPIKPLNDPGAPQDYDNLGPVSPQMMRDMHWLADKLRVGSLAWEPCLCVHCKRAGIEKCAEPECDLFDGC